MLRPVRTRHDQFPAAGLRCTAPAKDAGEHNITKDGNLPQRTRLHVSGRLLFAQLLSLCFILTALVLGRVDAFAQTDPGEAAVGVGIQAALAARDEALKRTAAAKAQQPGSAAAPATADTPPPPISEGDVSKPGFEGGPISYSVDLSSMIMGGHTNNNFASLPGGMDASLIYKVNRTTRLHASYYQFSATGIGTSDPKIPVFFQGTTTPIGSVDGEAMHLDSTTHLRFQVYDIERMFFVGGWHHPLIIAPTYVSVRSSVGGMDDSGTIFANNQIMTVHQRSYEIKGINLVIPLFYAEKYLIAYDAFPLWNMNTNGANRTNHMQYQQFGFAQYQPDPSLTIFANVGNVITYFPTDVYPYHVPTFHYGISKTIRAPFFIEAEVSTGGPSNPNYTDTGRIGIANLTVPCSRTAAGGLPTLTCVTLAGNGVAVPVIGAQRYTTFTVLFGFGSNPLVRSF